MSINQWPEQRPADRPAAEPVIGTTAHAVQLVAGLVVGLALADWLAVFFWLFAPAAPLLLGLATAPWRRTMPFGVGAVAAALCSFVFIVVALVLGV
jgi:hypothetical protein